MRPALKLSERILGSFLCFLKYKTSFFAIGLDFATKNSYNTFGGGKAFPFCVPNYMKILIYFMEVF